MAAARRRRAGAGRAAPAARPRDHRPEHRHHRAQAAAAATPAGGPADQRDRRLHLRHRPPRTADRARRDRPGSARPAGRAARGVDLRDAGPDRRSGRTSTGSTRRCRCSATGSSSAGGPTSTATGWSPRPRRESPTGRWARRAASARADRPPARQVGPAARHDSSSPATPRRRRCPLVWLRLVLSCLMHAVGYLLGKVPRRSAGRVGRAGLVRRASRPDLASCAAGPPAIDPCPAPPRSSARCGRRGGRACGWPARRSAGPLSDRYRSVAGERGRGLAGRADRRRLQLGRRRGAQAAAGCARSCSLIAARGGGQPGRRPRPVRARLAGRAGPAAGPRLAAPICGTRSWAPIPGAPGEITPPWLALTAVGSTLTWPGGRSGSPRC